MPLTSLRRSKTSYDADSMQYTTKTRGLMVPFVGRCAVSDGEGLMLVSGAISTPLRPAQMMVPEDVSWLDLRVTVSRRWRRQAHKDEKIKY